MTTDLTPMRTKSLAGRLRIVEFQRLRAGDWAAVDPIASPVETVPGDTLLLIAVVRDRFPIRNVRVEAACDDLGGVEAAPVGMVHFPEGSTHLPDPILETAACDVSANTTQSFLLKLTVPADAAVREYDMRVTARSDSHGHTTESVSIRVCQPARSPIDGSGLDHRITFWPHWTSFCRYYGLELWSEAFWQRAEVYLREMAVGGTNVVTANIVEDPFHYPLPAEHYHFNHFPGMIRWIRARDGRFRFDYSIYDRYVELNLAIGIDREIECHAMLPCKMQRPWLHYFDESEGREVSAESSQDAPMYRDAWSQFLPSFVEHNRHRGWLDRLTLCIYDEPQDEHSFRSAAELARRFAPQVRITAAITPQMALALKDVLNIATLNAGMYDAGMAAELRAAGIEVRWYNCCTPAWANTLFVSPLCDAYRMPWITEAQNLGGYLRWSMFAWTDDPLRDPAFNWPTGDTCLLYPGQSGPASSLRWEAYKLGLADLRRFHAVHSSVHDQMRRQLDAHLHELGRMAPTADGASITRWRQRLHTLIHISAAQSKPLPPKPYVTKRLK